MPLHEFYRAIIRGDFQYYDPTQSRIGNVFDLQSDDTREHFLMLFILVFVQQLGESSPNGFVADTSVYEMAQAHGFTQEQIGAQLSRALDYKLISRPVSDDPTTMRITSIGAFLHKKLVVEFSYLDAVVVDTPVTNRDFRVAIQDVQSIRDRLDRGDLFLTYLDQAWSDSAFDLDTYTVFDWKVASQKARKQIAEIRERLWDANSHAEQALW